MKSPQRYAKVWELIEAELPENGVLYEVSEERWLLDPRGSWKLSEETAGTNPDTGEAEAHMVLDRRVGPRPNPPLVMLFADAVCEAAFEDHAEPLRAEAYSGAAEARHA
jgi:hypothetical protein